MKKILIISVIGILLVAGITAYVMQTGSEETADVLNATEKSSETTQDIENKSASESIIVTYSDKKEVILQTETADQTDEVNGVWSGKVTFAENISSPRCFYDGVITLSVSGASATTRAGMFTIEVTNVKKSPGASCWNVGKFPTRAVTVSIQNQTVTWVDSIVEFKGTFAGSGNMPITFESCPNQKCTDSVTAVGVEGSGTLLRKL